MRPPTEARARANGKESGIDMGGMLACQTAQGKGCNIKSLQPPRLETRYILTLNYSREVDMGKKLFAGAGVVALAAWVLTAQNTAAPVIDSALKALGSQDLKTMEFSGSGAEFCLGQQYNGTSGYPKFN